LDGIDHGRGAGHLGEIVTSGVTSLLGHFEQPDDTIFEVNGRALAATVQAFGLWPGMIKLDIKHIRELTRGIGHESNKTIGFIDVLLGGPGLHHRAVVDAKHDDFVDSLLFKIVRSLNIAWNLNVGSGRGIGAGKGNQQHVFSGNSLPQIDFFGWKTKIQIDRWDTITHRNSTPTRCPKCK